MPYGQDYNSALSAWDQRSLLDRLGTLGITGQVDEGGNQRYYDQSGQLMRFDGSQPGATTPDRAGAFNGQDYFSKLGIIPIDPTLTNNGPGVDSPRMSPAEAQAWQDNQARSYNQFGFNFQNYDDMLRHMAGPGHYEDDPTLGRIYVPDNRDSNKWNLDFMGKSAVQGGALNKTILNAANSGAFVKAPALAVLGAGYGDIFNAGANPWFGGPDVPYDVGQNLVNNPDVFNPGADPSLGVNPQIDQPYDVGDNLVNNPDVFNGTQPPAPVTTGTPTMNPGNPAPGTPGYVPGGASAAQGLLSKILNGSATADDYTKLLGTIGSTGVGLFGADAQRSAYNSAADKYLALGEPSRARLEASYQPGFSMANEPGYKDALDQGTQSFLRAASAGNAPGVSSGNPFGNPGAWAETQKYVDNNFTLPQLNNYRNQNAAQGGLGLGIAGTNSTAGAGTAGQGYNAAGYGLGQITNPTSGIDDWLKKLTQGGLGGLGGFKLNLGSGLT